MGNKNSGANNPNSQYVSKPNKGNGEYPLGKYCFFATKNKNIVWIGTMSLCWRQLADFKNVPKLQFINPNEKALETINSLNESPFSKESINPKDIYTKAGLGPKTQDLINKEVKQKFPNYSFPKLDEDMFETSIISFAYLYKRLSFAVKFQKRSNPSFTFNEKKVSSFWASSKEQKQQIRVGFYQNKDDFFISIPDKKTNDVIHLLKKDSITTVEEALKAVKDRENKNPSFLLETDQFEMPMIDIDCQQSYKEMIGLFFSNTEFKDYYITVMRECLKLKVDESGAKVQSMAVMVSDDQCCYIWQEPRYFILDKSFWLVMQEEGRHPYLCVKIVEPTDK